MYVVYPNFFTIAKWYFFVCFTLVCVSSIKHAPCTAQMSGKSFNECAKLVHNITAASRNSILALKVRHETVGHLLS